MPVREEVAELADRLDRGERLGPALRAFAARLADPAADLVAAALLLAAEHQARNLGELLAASPRPREPKRRCACGSRPGGLGSAESPSDQSCRLG